MDRLPRPVNVSHVNGSPARAGLLLALALSLAGCSFFQQPPVQRGNRVTADQLQEITVGVQTKKDVEALIGSPTQTSTFDNNIWYYISAKTRIRPARQLALTDQEILVVSFDGQGVVRSLQRVGADEMRPIEMVSRETPTPGSDRSFLQSLFGNIGRVGAGGLSSGGQAPAGTTTQGGPQGPGAGALR